MTKRGRRRPIALRELGRMAQSAWGFTFVAILVPSVAFLALGKDSWAGASDDKVSSVISTTYASYLRQVGALLTLVTLSEWALLGFATLGVLILVWERIHARAGRNRWARDGLLLGVALVVVATYVGFAVQRHPGLFLEALSASALLQLWVESCAYLGPLVLLAAIGGYGWALYRGTNATRLVVAILLGLVVAGGVRVRRKSAKYKPKPFEPAAVASTSEPHPRRAARPVTLRRAPHILWLAVDSLRPDKIDPRTTPRIARLLAESVSFANAIVPVPRTGPSWAAALTSLAPLTNGIETMFPSRSLSDLSKLALPAHLADNGYRTLVTSEYAGEFFGRVDFGFQTASVPRAELMQISGQVLLSRTPLALAHFGLGYSASAWARAQEPPELLELVRGMPNFSQPDILADDVLAQLEPGRPLFALAFYSQPHFPYTSSPEYGKRFHVAGSSASIRYGRDVASDTPINNEADRRQLDGLYRASLAESDAAIGRLLDLLAARGVLEDTIVILSADHGEGLYDCAECVGHGDNLRSMMTLRVPLAFRLPKHGFPNAKPQVVSALVSTMDVYPTLLSVLGIPPVVVHEGRALLGADGNPIDIPERTLFVETGEWLWSTAAVPKDRLAYPPITEMARLEDDRIAIDPKYEPVIRAAKHRAAVRPPYKLVYEPTATGARWRLFDFTKDPLDEHDLSPALPDVAAKMKDDLRKDVLRHAFVIPVGDYFLTRPPMPSDDHW